MIASMKIDEFLKTYLGKVITRLTQYSYYDIAYPRHIKVKKYHSPLTCLDAIYFNLDEYDIFIFQGTTSLVDWVADLKMALGIKPRQFKRALKFVKNNGNKNKKTIIAGHSLGGAITEYVISELKCTDNLLGVTYNGAGVKHLLKNKNKNVHIYNYISDRDILNRLTRKLPFGLFDHLGETLILKDEEFKNGFKSHSNFRTFQN